MSSASKRLIEQFNDPSAWDHIGEEFPVMIEHTMCQLPDGTKHAVVKGKALPEGAKVLYEVGPDRIERIYRNAKRNFELDKPIKLFREHSNVPGSERVGWYGEPKLADWNGTKAVVTRRYVDKGKGNTIKGYVERSPEYFPRVDELTAVALLPPSTEPRLAMGIEAETYSGERQLCVFYAGDLLPEYGGALPAEHYRADAPLSADRGSGPLWASPKKVTKPEPLDLAISMWQAERDAPMKTALYAAKYESQTRKHYADGSHPHREATDQALDATRAAVDQASHAAAADLHEKAAKLHDAISEKHRPRWWQISPSQKQVDLHHDHRNASDYHRDAAEMHRHLSAGGQNYSTDGAEHYKASYPSGYGERGERGAGSLPSQVSKRKRETKPDAKSEGSPSTPNLDALDHPAAKWAGRASRAARSAGAEFLRDKSRAAFGATYQALTEGKSHADAASAHLNAASSHAGWAEGYLRKAYGSPGASAESVRQSEVRGKRVFESHRRAWHRHLKAAMEHMKADKSVMASHKEWHDNVFRLHKGDLLSEDYAMPDEIQNPQPQPVDPTGTPNGSQVDLSPEEQQAASLVVQAMAGNPKLLTIIATALFQAIPEFGYLKAMAEQAMSPNPVPSPPQPSPQGGAGMALAAPPTPQMMAVTAGQENYAAKLAAAEAALQQAESARDAVESQLARSEAARIMAGWDTEGIRYSRERESVALATMSAGDRAKHDKHVREFYAKSQGQAPVGGPPIPVHGVNTVEMEAYSPSAADVERVLHANKWSPQDSNQWDKAVEIAKKERFGVKTTL